jgi:16S rRNA (cytosine1402-N4)-methyltransferase
VRCGQREKEILAKQGYLFNYAIVTLKDDPQNLHIPVLLEPILEFLPSSKLKIFDGTFGGGGYTKSFLERGNAVWASDWDVSVVEKFASLDPKLTLVNSSFADYINTFEDGFFDVIVLDLGFSSNQLEYSGRGFSYQKDDEELDLRYNEDTGKPAWEKLFRLKDNAEFVKVLFNYSGEKLSKRIADIVFDDILENRNMARPLTVGEFKNWVVAAIPAKFKKHTNGILSRVWQALRIWVNNEFDQIERFLPVACDKLKPGGRLMIVTFHSLEDKIVTKFMRTVARPIEIDTFGNKAQAFKILTPKMIEPSEAEVLANSRSRSSGLRVMQKV